MRRALLASALVLLSSAALPAAASAEFGFKEAGVRFDGAGAEAERQAGTHPYEVTTTLAMNTVQLPEGASCEAEFCELPDGAVEDLAVSMPAGFVGDPRAVPRCSAADFIASVAEGQPACPDPSAVGIAAIKYSFTPSALDSEEFFPVPVYSLEPPPGTAARLGFAVLGVRVTIDVALNPNPPYNVIARPTNIAQAAHFYSSVLALWGDPSSPAHDFARGSCSADAFVPEAPPILDGRLNLKQGAEAQESEQCSFPLGDRRPFLTLPRSCEGPLEIGFAAKSWPIWRLDGEGVLRPGPALTDTATAQSPGMLGCSRLGLSAQIGARPTSRSAESPTGLDFSLSVEDPGITSVKEGALAGSDIKRAVVTLPEGMTVNPSQAEGLDTCSEADLARETLAAGFGEGCPAASKIGALEVESPLLENEVFHGQLYVATPHANLASDSLIAFYIVVKDRELGLLVKQPARVEPDPETGQLITTTTEMPQLPFSEFRLRFREGGRSPLVTPPACGDYEVEAVLTPWANPGTAYEVSSSFDVSAGPGGGPCPAGRPFEPGFAAGSLNPAAGQHSPFAMRLTRRDGDQDLTRFDAVLPPGVTAKLAGVPWCPDGAIAAAKGRDGKDELAAPSCPAASQIGTVQGGAGVGSQLTYVPGKIYLAGPVGGAPLSVVAIVPAVAGPFDVGTVVVRQALDLDPVTGVAEVNGALSDPIPHILAGIPLRVRDIQVSVDRPGFALNPTSCAEMATLAGIWGGGSDVFSRADDLPVLRQARFQAAGCRGLGFEPRLAVKLKGGVRRGAFPALRAHYRPRPGDANLRRLALALPDSAFIEQGHFRTICTRVQFAAGPGHGAACPQGSVYGRARVWTPLLEEPLQGPVILRSSDHNLPDAVFALRGPASAAVELEVAVRIDSVGGRLRATVESAPDAPVSRAIVDMGGGQKGLFVNSRHLCLNPGRNRARANLRGQNGKASRTRPRVVAAKCGKRRGARRSAVGGSREAG